MNLVPGTPVGKYVVRRKLAEGGMAEIYLASLSGPEGFEKDVVIKRIRSYLASDPAFVEMFKAEARVASRLNHANIVQIFDFGKHEDSWYIAMEYVRGRSLWDLRKRSRERMTAVPPTLVAHIGSEVARGLHYAHKLKLSGRPLGLVHRDVTPHNVLLSYEGAVKLTDFGIAKDGSRLTSPGTLKGKFAYMSPEQARGDEVDARTDVFALGIVLWEMLTGARLFVSDSDVATLRAVQEGVIVPPARLNPEVRPELDAAVMRALERDRSKRFQTAQELERALRQFVLRSAESVDETDPGAFLRRLFAAELRGEGVDRTSVRMAAVDAEPARPVPDSSAASSGQRGSGGASSGVAETAIAAGRAEEEDATPRIDEQPQPAPGGKKITVPMRVPRRAAHPADEAGPSTPPPGEGATPSPTSHATVPLAAAPAPRRRRALFAAIGAALLGSGAIALAVHAAAAQRLAGASAAGDSGPDVVAAPVGRDQPSAPPQVGAPAGAEGRREVPAASIPANAGEEGGSPEAPRHAPRLEADAAGLATLVVNVTPWANVVIEGEDQGEVVGKRQWDLPSGRYLVRFIHPKKRINKVVQLTRARRTTVRFDALAE